jgi:glycosyltransferase involved in cell wall biosynthesis
VYPYLRSIKDIKRKAFWLKPFRIAKATEYGIVVLRYYAWGLPPFLNRLNRDLYILAVKYLIKQLLKSGEQIDILHAQCVSWGGMAAREIKRKYGIPYVITEHSSGFVRGSLRRGDKSAIRLAFMGSAAIIAVSESLKNAISPFVGGKKVFVIPNCVDSQHFALRKPRTDSEYRIVSVAGLTKNKAFEVLIAAFVSTSREFGDARLTIAGNGPEKRQLQKLVTEAGITKRATILGALDRSSVAKLLSDSDLFVSSSRHETFGVVLVEAMMSGLPVVATRCGGPEEIVASSELGMLVDVDNVAGLSAAIKQMRERHRAGQIDSSSIRAYARRNYDFNHVAALLERLLVESCSVNLNDHL